MQTKQSIMIAMAVTTTLAAAYGCARNDPQVSAPSNVVLITIDALRADFVSYAGHVQQTTPNLDSLAAESAVFTTAITSFPGTTASMPSLMSGRFPNFEDIDAWNRTTHFGFNDIESPEMSDPTDLTDNLTMLAEIMSKHGFLTIGFNTNPHLGPANNFNQGFDEYDSFWTYLKTARENRDHSLQGNYPPAAPVLDKVVARASALGDRRFFLWIHLMEPHSPYLPPPEYARKFDREFSDRTDLEINEAVYHQLYQQRGATKRAADYLSHDDLGLDREAFRQHLLGLYEGEINYCDRQIQRLISRLKNDGLLEDTLIVITADHGEEFFDHGFVMHHFSSALAEELIRIPLVIRPPGGISRGRTIDELVRMVDIAPTILDYLDLRDESAGMDGRSLRPLIEGDSLPPAPAYISTIDYGILRTEQWKYRLEKQAGPDGSPVERLFDIVDDPMETTDQSATSLEVLVGLRKSWRDFAAGLQSRGTGMAMPMTTPGADDQLDEATREQLEALGYVDN